MKRKGYSMKAMNAYNEGYARGIDISLLGKKLILKDINPYSPFINRKCWEAFNTGAKDAYMFTNKQRENQRVYQRMQELNEKNKSKPKGLEKER